MISRILQAQNPCGKKIQGFYKCKILAGKNFKDFTSAKSLRKKISGILQVQNPCGKKIQGFYKCKILAGKKFKDSTSAKSLREKKRGFYKCKILAGKISRILLCLNANLMIGLYRLQEDEWESFFLGEIPLGTKAI
jgi:hypothetical protein